MNQLAGATSAPRPRRSATTISAEDFVNAVLTASRVLVGVSARSLAELEDTVTLPQFRTLVVLESHGEMNLNTLADLLDVTPSTAMRMIDRLISANLAFRVENPTNRREVVLGLTRQGETLVRKVTDRRRREIARIVKTMPEGKRVELVAALNAFAEAAREPQPSDHVATALGW